MDPGPVTNGMSELSYELIMRCRRGDDAGWRELFAGICPLSRWVVSHTLFNSPPDVIDDISMETMEALVQNIRKIEDVIHLKRFVRRVTLNKCIDFIRKNPKIFVDIADKDLPEEADPWVENSVVEALRRAVAELREPCRSIVRSRFLLNMSHKEIAEKTGIDIKQIGVRLGRCLALLGNILDDRHHISRGDVL